MKNTSPRPSAATRPMSRRDMLKASAIGLAAPWILSSCGTVRGARRSPSETIRIGCIGTGRMGRGDRNNVLRQGLLPEVNARVVAVCDADLNRALLAKAEIEKFYAENAPDEPRARIAIYSDYRDLLARSDIDGVTISTPDHWHAFHAIAAANAKKDIYLQKPLTYAINEGKALVRAVRRNGVILQTGSQQRSEANFRQACQIVRNGRLGKLREIRVTLPADQGTGKPDPMPVPENLDYDMWLGPAPEAPYTEHRVHPQKGFGRPGFLQVERHCLGMITGWGSHMFDIAQWGHGDEHLGPVEVQATAEFPDRGLFDVHTRFEAEAVYADGVRLVSATDSPGVRFTGDDGWLFVGRGKLEAHDPALLKEDRSQDPVQLYVSNHHMRNFLESMRTRKDPVCAVEIGHRSNSICVMTHIAMKLGRKLRWDPRAERFIDDDEANAMLSPAYRDSSWKI